MLKVNIPRTITDPKYRYQMPLIQLKIEGRGINIRTNLTNLREVAKSLRVPSEYILKFMGYEFGTKINTKDNINSFNGEMSQDDVLKVLDKFIDKYVLCSKCKLPEPVLQINNNKELINSCNSCGNVAKMDTKHKLTSFILKNPPKNNSEIKTKKGLTNEIEVKEDKDEDKFCKIELKEALRASEFLPQNTDENLFDKFTNYLHNCLPINSDYIFDDSHILLVYKAIKRVRMEKELYDRVGYILFKYIFASGLASEFVSKATLFEGVLERHQMGKYVNHETLLNLQFYFYHSTRDQQIAKKIPTIMKKFFDLNLLTKVSLLGIFV